MNHQFKRTTHGLLTRRHSGHRSCASCVIPPPRRAGSTHQAVRRLVAPGLVPLELAAYEVTRHEGRYASVDRRGLDARGRAVLRITGR